MPQNARITKPAGPFDPDAVYTYAEAAPLLKVTERAVKRWVIEGRLRYIQYPRGRRLRGAVLNAFIAECEHEE